MIIEGGQFGDFLGKLKITFEGGYLFCIHKLRILDNGIEDTEYTVFKTVVKLINLIIILLKIKLSLYIVSDLFTRKFAGFEMR